jgi:outer membrane murein-binding lipoprotein Lpp
MILRKSLRLPLRDLRDIKMGQSVKQMMIVAGGVCFAISLLCLIAGVFSSIEKNKVEKQVKTLGEQVKTLGEQVKKTNQGGDIGRILNGQAAKDMEQLGILSQKLALLETSVSGSFTAAGVTGATAIGLGIAGRNKK